MSSSTGRVVPLSLPTSSPNLRVLKSLRSHATQLASRLEKLQQLDAQLTALPDEPRWDALIPIVPGSSLGFAKGQITDTNTVLVKLGSEDDEYWVEYSAKQARGVAERKAVELQAKLAKVQAAIQDAETTIGREMGYVGGRLNENNELINEEGLPFVDIQEFEEDEAGSTPQAAPIPSVSKPLAPAPPPAPGSPKAPPESIDEQPPPAAPAKPAEKRVTFSRETKPAADDRDIPTIQSPAVASGSSRTTSSSATPIVQPTVIERPVKPSIIEKEITKPPPVLTAAERHLRSEGGSKAKSSNSEAESFDGVVPPTISSSSLAGKKAVDLSAYLPRSLRNSNTAQQRTDIKGKGRAISEDRQEETAEDEDLQEDDYDQDDGEDDSDDFYNYEDSDEDAEDNVHIDDLMAMREAALEYHAKRYNLGAGAGTGPLGGDKDIDAYEDPAHNYEQNQGLPFTASYENDDGSRQPSRFRTGRLQKAQLFIPELQPGEVDIGSSILPGDSLGPYEAPEEANELQEDFKGMTKEEIQTFLRYVKALETGEDLDSVEIVPAKNPGDEDEEEIRTKAEAEDEGPQPPAIQTSVREKVALTASVVEKPMTAAPDPVQSDKPKRVSRFRAAREGQ